MINEMEEKTCFECINLCLVAIVFDWSKGSTPKGFNSFNRVFDPVKEDGTILILLLLRAEQGIKGLDDKVGFVMDGGRLVSDVAYEGEQSNDVVAFQVLVITVFLYLSMGDR
jgi:hypothetical protein